MSEEQTTAVIDGEAQEIGTEVVVHDHAPPAALFRTDDPVEVVQKATRVADALKDVLEQRKLYENIQGKQHVKVEGWQLVGAMLGVTAICVHTEAVDGGFLATVEARTTDGRVVGRADAVCTKHERRGPWKNADDYARLSMAQTRATSKALKGPLGFVVSLAGYATTPAEEMTFAAPDAEPVRKDVKQTPGRSDIPADDPEWPRISAQIRVPGTAPLLKTYLLETLGVALPANLSSWKRVVAELSPENRAKVTAWLQAREDAKADVPWTEEGAVDALKAGLGAEEVPAA